MNVLLVSPEFPPSYWSFENACGLMGCKALCPPHGLITVAALLPDDWELRLVDLAVRALTEDDWIWADLVMISAMVLQREGVLRVVSQAKQHGKTVVIGGPYPSSLPDELVDAGCDFVVKGEGENTVPLLLKALEEGVGGGVIEVDEKPEMSTCAVPRYDLLSLEDYIVLPVQTSRGCPFNCEFCDIIRLFGRTPRYKSPEQVIEEIETIHRLGWKREVFITDDNFIGNKQRARAILAKLTPWMERQGKPFSFWTQASVNLGQDLELVDLMTEANFNTVFVGTESPDEDVLRLTRKYQNITNPLAESLNNIRENGLTVVASFIIGFDGEKPGVGDRICSFVDLTSIPLVMLNTLQAAPNTALWDRLTGEGRILQDLTTGQSTGARLNYVPTRPEREILDEYLRAWEYLYDPERYLERTYRYFLSMRPTRKALGQQRKIAVSETVPVRRLSIREKLADLFRFLRVVWRQGVKPPYRLQYWKQLLGMRARNPSRLVKYLNMCALGENMFGLTQTIRDNLADGLGDGGKGCDDHEDVSGEGQGDCPAKSMKRVISRG
ncbi:MAG: B12-binding domain-containing radical SAM protein [Pseudomonadota bacterium]